MLNRRQFLGAAAGAAALIRSPKAFTAMPAKYDLIVKNGRVIDPSLKLDAIRDVAIAGGRIAAIETNIAGDASEVIDARGKLVVPGLIDIHTHAARVKEGPALCLADGVTGFIDAGSQGADHIADTVAVAKSAPQPGRVLINIGRAGILPEGDTPMLRPRGTRSRATATSSWASKRASPTTLPAITITKCFGAHKKWRLHSICP